MKKPDPAAPGELRHIALNHKQTDKAKEVMSQRQKARRVFEKMKPLKNAWGDK